jgi:hypothetical protein
MTAISGTNPNRGVRYIFTLMSSDDHSAHYTVSVSTALSSVDTKVLVSLTACALEEPCATLDPAHVTQLLALAKTLAKREDTPWPRRVERWRSPGVR